jgi:hypothetical protein
MDYLHNVYDIKMSEIEKQMFQFINKYAYDVDIYKDYYSKNDYRKDDDGSREYWIKKAKKFYKDFQIQFFDDTCLISGLNSSLEIHHIHPLVYGGNNHIENMIHVAPIIHELLHENPLEHDFKACHIAIDHVLLAYRGYKRYWLLELIQDYRKENKQLIVRKFYRKLRDKVHDYYDEFFV